MVKLKYFFYAIFYRFIFKSGALFRRLTSFSFNYMKLKKLKDLHKGERVFIVATGPSLTEKDIISLKDEYTISMNSIVKLTKKLDWEPSYYVIQDFGVYENLKHDISSLNTSKVLVGHNLKWKYNMKNDYTAFPIDFIDHLHSNYMNLNTKFSTNLFSQCYDGYTVAYSCLQLAYYLGFAEVFLIGIDASYGVDIEKNNIVPSGKFDPTYKEAGVRINYAFDVAAKHLEGSNMVVHNVTDGGMLNSFRRIKLSEVL